MFAVGVLMGWGEKGNLEDYGNVARLAKGVEYDHKCQANVEDGAS